VTYKEKDNLSAPNITIKLFLFGKEERHPVSQPCYTCPPNINKEH
jgi:hypothetical protein